MQHVPFLRTALLAAALLLPSTLAAQDWGQPWADPDDRPGRVDLSASIGILAPSDWSDLVLLGSISSTSGLLEQVLVRDLRVEPDRELGAAVTYWRGRYGFRVQGGYSSSAVLIGGPIPEIDGLSDQSLSVGVDTWLYDIRGAIGLLEYEPAMWVWPYGFFGFGGITYDLERRIGPPLLTFVEGGRTDPADAVVNRDRGRAFLLAVDELGLETVFAFNFGVGTDFRIPIGPGGIGIRLEVSDHIASSPVGLRVGELRRSGALASDTGITFGVVHHLRAAAGVMVQVGR